MDWFPVLPEPWKEPAFANTVGGVRSQFRVMALIVAVAYALLSAPIFVESVSISAPRSVPSDAWRVCPARYKPLVSLKSRFATLLKPKLAALVSENVPVG